MDSGGFSSEEAGAADSSGFSSEEAAAPDTTVSTEQPATAATTEAKIKKQKKQKPGIVIQVGNKKKEAKRLKGSFLKKQGVRYFKKQNGKLAKDCFFTKGSEVYHADRKGVLSAGWVKLKGHYYFFDRKTGRLRRNQKIDLIRIGKSGIARETKLNVDRIKVYLEAQKVVKKVSKPTDSKKEKLYKCYKWLAAFPYKQYRTMRTAKAAHPKDWDIVFANDIFIHHMGCCASEASAFAYLAKVCGYEDVRICSDTGHAWTDIGGRLYDPLFAEARSFQKNYNAAYWDYRKNAAYSLKL